MTFASYIRRERIARILLPRGGLAGHWRGEIVYKLQRVFVSLSILLYVFLRSNTMSMPFKVKRNTWSIAEEKYFLLLCKEKAITYVVKSWTKSSSRLVTNSCRRVLFSSRRFIESTLRVVKLSRWVVESSRRVVHITYKSITRIFFSDSSTRRVAL